ncbi:MAG TPA: NADH-quinone oxidoreductase subunit NuoE [Chloroflexi bacterium]|nr:NADH-quinone oxidoreductase subunit NuoE [Chloroflexota bacterium]
MALLDTRKEDIEHHLSKYPDKRSAIMPLLYIAQEEYGYITEEAMQEIAELLDVDITHVKGVVGFYGMYYDKPKGKYLLYICTDLPCALRGAEEFSQHVCEKLGIQPGETTPDGIFTVENVMCIGACHRAPVMQVNFHFHENMDEEKADQLIEDLRREVKATEPYRSE